MALADLYVYPGDDWMGAHEHRMAQLAGGGSSSRGAGSSSSSGSSSRGGGRGSGGGGLSPFQAALLGAAYGALEEVWEGYAAPRAGERY